MTMPRDGRHGLTLIELIVVLAIIGIMAGVVGLALHTAKPVAASDPVRDEIIAAIDSAARIGRRVTITIRSGAGLAHATAYPDGRVVADSALSIDAMTGDPR